MSKKPRSTNSGRNMRSVQRTVSAAAPSQASDSVDQEAVSRQWAQRLRDIARQGAAIMNDYLRTDLLNIAAYLENSATFVPRCPARSDGGKGEQCVMAAGHQNLHLTQWGVWFGIEGQEEIPAGFGLADSGTEMRSVQRTNTGESSESALDWLLTVYLAWGDEQKRSMDEEQHARYQQALTSLNSDDFALFKQALQGKGHNAGN